MTTLRIVHESNRGTHILEQPTFFKLDLKPSQEEEHLAWYWKLNQLHRASQVMDLRGKSTIAIWLN